MWRTWDRVCGSGYIPIIISRAQAWEAKPPKECRILVLVGGRILERVDVEITPWYHYHVLGGREETEVVDAHSERHCALHVPVFSHSEESGAR